MEKIDIQEINTGDIIMTSGSSWLSETIQKFQKIENKQYGKFSHSGIAWWSYNTLMIIEAQKYGICITPFEKHYMNDNFKSLMVLKPKIHIDGSVMANQMLPYCGTTRYDFKNLLLEQPIKILFGKWIGEKKQNPKKFICHEWSAYATNRYFERYGIPVFLKETQVNAIDLCTNDFFTHHLLK